MNAPPGRSRWKLYVAVAAVLYHFAQMSDLQSAVNRAEVNAANALAAASRAAAAATLAATSAAEAAEAAQNCPGN